MERALAASGSDRYRYRGPARTSPRRRAWSLHPSFYRGPAESAVSTPVLYFGWNAAINFALVNLLGLVVAVATGHWYMQQMYARVYAPVLFIILLLGIAGILPRVRRSTVGEGWERRYFYGTVWAVTLAQTVLLVLWKTLPRSHDADVVKLAVYCAVLLMVALAAAAGLLPRTRPILPGELVIAD